MADHYELKRHFEAAPALVWTAWTDPEHVARWYGPGIETIIHGYDLREGGEWLTEMKHGGMSMYQRADFTVVDEGVRLSCIQANTDADWTVIGNMMLPDWPWLLELDVRFAPSGAGTDMVLTWKAHEASDSETAAFAAGVATMGGGWAAGMDILNGILGELAG